MLFVSYASHDRALVDPLVAFLRTVDRQVWFDRELDGGDVWWQTILDRIRNCSVFVVALSNNSVQSKPCQIELEYAQALHRPVLPVQIGPLDHVRVTRFAETQHIPFPDRDSGDRRLADALHTLARRQVPLPVPLPPEPAVPFEYLTRLAMDISRPELGYQKQLEIVRELRYRFDQDRRDPTVCADIVQLLNRLRDRSEVAALVIPEIDAILQTYNPMLSSPTLGMPVASITGPRPVIVPPAPAAEPDPGDDAAESGRWSTRRKLLAAGAAVVVLTGAGTVGVTHFRPPSPEQGPLLADDTDVAAVMHTPGMVTVESDGENFKQGGSIDASRPDCVGVLYPGMDRIYADSQATRATWAVLEEPGGLERAGVNGKPFVDQDVATFPAKSGAAAAFVERSLPQWRGCEGQTVTVNYPDNTSYSWVIGPVAGESPRISQTFTMGPDGYTCQRVLNAVADTAIDVKACGGHITDEAGVITNMISALVAHAPSY